MSTLTKVLIVLLSLSVFALCALTGTYVATADNYKQQFENQRTNMQTAQQQRKKAVDDWNEAKANYERLENQLRKQITDLQNQKGQLRDEVANLQRENTQLVQEVNGWASTVEGWTKTKQQQAELLEKTLADKEQLEEKQIQLSKELKETTQTLLEKMAIIDNLETLKKQLQEEKAELQAKIDNLLKPQGRQYAATTPVTMPREKAQPVQRYTAAARDTQPIGLQGLIIQVDMKNTLASISLGKADGVQEGMKFFATRGDEFICEVLITDVDMEKAVGIIEYMQYQPRTGDNVSTNL